MTFSTSFRVTAALLTLALVVGGAGVAFPLLQLALGSAAILAAAYFLWCGPRSNRTSLESWASLLLGLVLILPWLQLVPLPPGLWHRLPGREVPIEIDSILGLKIFRPWTLDVEGTVRSALVLIPSAVVFSGCLRTNAKERMLLLSLVALFAVLNAVLGIVQLATDGSATLYPSTHTGYPVGFFVNRNHSAALMLATMPLVAALASARLNSRKVRLSGIVGALSIIAILSIVIIGTSSRAGLLLLPISLLISLFLLFRHRAPLRSTLPILGAVVAVGLVLVTSRGFNHVLDRFASGDDPRFAYWENLQWALQHYGAWGTGGGTFVPVFQTSESLEGLVPQIINHAHNDFLEVFLEFGVPSALILAAFFALTIVIIAGNKGTAEDAAVAPVRLAGATGVALLLAYSVVDYPLRMPAIASVFAVLYASLLPVGPITEGRGRRSTRRSRGVGRGGVSTLATKAVAGAVLLDLWTLMLQAAMSARALQDRRYADAASWAFWSTRAKEGQATDELSKSRIAEAWRHAVQSLRLSPIDAPAIRDLGLIQILDGKNGARLMWIAAGLGWRDVITQLWTIDAANNAKDPEVAVQRAEGLFRQRKAIRPALQLLLQTPNIDEVARLLADDLAQDPYWRTDVLRAVGGLSPRDSQRFGKVLSRLAGLRGSMTSAEMRPLLMQMLASGRGAEAQSLWAKRNPALIDNGNFRPATDAGEGSRLPSGWDIAPENRQSMSVSAVDSSKERYALRVAHTDWVTLMMQDVLLPSGGYNLFFDAREGGDRPVTLRWQLRCQKGLSAGVGDVEVSAHQGWKRYSVSFAVPNGDCFIQKLALKRIQGDNGSDTWLKRIEFRRVGN